MPRRRDQYSPVVPSPAQSVGSDSRHAEKQDPKRPVLKWIGLILGLGLIILFAMSERTDTPFAMSERTDTPFAMSEQADTSDPLYHAVPCGEHPVFADSIQAGGRITLCGQFPVDVFGAVGFPAEMGVTDAQLDRGCLTLRCPNKISIGALPSWPYVCYKNTLNY